MEEAKDARARERATADTRKLAAASAEAAATRVRIVTEPAPPHALAALH